MSHAVHVYSARRIVFAVECPDMTTAQRLSRYLRFGLHGVIPPMTPLAEPVKPNVTYHRYCPGRGHERD